MTIHVLAAVAEHERQIIGERTRAALAAAKARGVCLGSHGRILAVKHKNDAVDYAIQMNGWLAQAREAGARTTREIAVYLNNACVPSRENGRWHAASVARVLKRSMRAAPPTDYCSWS